MYRRTAALSLASSTRGGMRRLLKQRPSPEKFIRQAVESGVYKNLPQNDPSNPQNRNNYRNHQNRNGGGAVDRYPAEYEILRLNPSIPTAPNVTKKERKLEMAAMRKAGGQLRTVDRYVSSFMERYDAKMGCTRPVTEEEKDGYEYYKKVLRVEGADGRKGYNKSAHSKMGRKAPILDHAYDFALQQYELMQANDQLHDNADKMTEEESVRAVEEMLRAAEKQEHARVRTASRKIKRWRKAGGQRAAPSAPAIQHPADSPSAQTAPPPPLSTIPSVLSSKPRVIRALSIWGRRLRAVPYSRWTLGASTALDHWIAVDVLQMTEHTWEQLLDGAGAHADGGHVGKGKDIIAVRAMLFPETVQGDDGDDAIDEDAMGMDLAMEDADMDQASTQDYADATDRSIDELLASLGGGQQDDHTDDDDQPHNADDYAADGEQDYVVDEGDLDSRVTAMVDELQEWRAKNQEAQFQDWDQDAKDTFGKWMTKYIDLVTPDSNDDDNTTTNTNQIDIDATRDALLAEPPRTREESDTFFSRVQDEAEAEILLDHLTSPSLSSTESTTTTTTTAAAMDTDAQQAFDAFLKMPRTQQLQHLLNLGTLRPVLDEYSLESDRLKFLEHYSEILLEGIELEHLVSDPDGTITTRDIGDEALLSGVTERGGEEAKDARFRIEMMAYGTDNFDTKKSERARALYRAWNIHKAGRAKYEEFLYKSGKIRLEDGAQNSVVDGKKKK